MAWVPLTYSFETISHALIINLLVNLEQWQWPRLGEHGVGVPVFACKQCCARHLTCRPSPNAGPASQPPGARGPGLDPDSTVTDVGTGLPNC